MRISREFPLKRADIAENTERNDPFIQEPSNCQAGDTQGNFLGHVATNGQPSESWPTTDLKYLYRHLLTILNGKGHKQYCSKTLPRISSTSESF